MVEVRLFLTGTELENAQWKGPIQWAHLWGKNLLAIFISHIWKRAEKIMESSEKNQVNFNSGVIVYLELSVFTFCFVFL